MFYFSRYTPSRLLALIATTVLAVACTSEMELSEEANTPVAFVSETLPITATRAGVTYAMDYSQLQDIGFGVFAYHTGSQIWESARSNANPDFMYNQHVTYDATDTHTWEYEPLKYWPNGNQTDEGVATPDYISFFAYAPYVNVTGSTGIPTSGSTTEGIVALTDNMVTGDPKVKYVLATEAARQVDLLWGTRGKNSYDEADGTPNTSNALVNTDLTKQKTSERVSFLFKHALASIDVWVQRVYDEPSPLGKKPDADATKIFVNKLQLLFDEDAMCASGQLNLATGVWDEPVLNEALTLTSSGDQQIAATVIGTSEDNSNLTFVRNYELDDFKTKEGVNETCKRLTRDSYATMLIPRASGITFKPSLSYSFVTQDDELALTTVTATDGTRYHRILHNDVTGDPVTINPVEPGKRYTLICYIGVESVQFVLGSVEDWDFPIRITPDVTGYVQPGKPDGSGNATEDYNGNESTDDDDINWQNKTLHED